MAQISDKKLRSQSQGPNFTLEAQNPHNCYRQISFILGSVIAGFNCIHIYICILCERLHEGLVHQFYQIIGPLR